MIVIPRVLSQLLRDVEPRHARLIALDYAQHALTAGGDVIDPRIADVALEYLTRARRTLSEDGDIGELAAAHAAFHRVEGAEAVCREVLQVVRIAVSVACQREMESAGVIVRNRYQPDVSVVAENARSAVALIRTGGRRIPEGRWREAVWEEARWQVIRLLETALPPHERD